MSQALINVDKLRTITSAGTSATPALSSPTDPNTGMYFPSADTLALSTGGTEIVRVNSSGNVLIGTTTGGSTPKALTLGVSKDIALMGGNIYLGNTSGDFTLSKMFWDNTNNYTVIDHTLAVGAIDLRIGGISKLKIQQNTGVVEIANGIKFPATQVASSDVNTLDDYKEGTWTPTILDSGSVVSGRTYSSQIGKYVKIGKLVWISCDVIIGTFGTGYTGSVTIGGIPFNTIANGGNNLMTVAYGINTASYPSIGVHTSSTVPYLYVYYGMSQSYTLTTTQIAAFTNPGFTFSLVYMAGA